MSWFSSDNEKDEMKAQFRNCPNISISVKECQEKFKSTIKNAEKKDQILEHFENGSYITLSSLVTLFEKTLKSDPFTMSKSDYKDVFKTFTHCPSCAVPLSEYAKALESATYKKTGKPLFEPLSIVSPNKSLSFLNHPMFGYKTNAGSPNQSVPMILPSEVTWPQIKQLLIDFRIQAQVRDSKMIKNAFAMLKKQFQQKTEEERKMMLDVQREIYQTISASDPTNTPVLKDSEVEENAICTLLVSVEDLLQKARSDNIFANTTMIPDFGGKTQVTLLDIRSAMLMFIPPIPPVSECSASVTVTQTASSASSSGGNGTLSGSLENPFARRLVTVQTIQEEQDQSVTLPKDKLQALISQKELLDNLLKTLETYALDHVLHPVVDKTIEISKDLQQKLNQVVQDIQQYLVDATSQITNSSSSTTSASRITSSKVPKVHRIVTSKNNKDGFVTKGKMQIEKIKPVTVVTNILRQAHLVQTKEKQ
jgi:hypothetical protein